MTESGESSTSCLRIEVKQQVDKERGSQHHDHDALTFHPGPRSEEPLQGGSGIKFRQIQGIDRMYVLYIDFLLVSK